jgi:hypothetical protein
MRTSIWTKEETDTLLKYITEKKPLTAFSEKYKRSNASIRSRLKAVAAEMYLKDKKSFDEIYKVTGIDKSEVIISKGTPVAPLVAPPVAALVAPLVPKLIVPPVIAVAKPELIAPPIATPIAAPIAPLIPKLVVPSYTIRSQSPFETVFDELLTPIIKSLSTSV